ncbi:MAG: DUF2589 domain-containing protein [Desulfosarcina sp.]|nr:DUF2589 domain-containing protein [Desulfosarcina sp.]MBC2742411.1 DUF2589 domain-containing protein [Desulfosarcina sp.]MBC2765321.1 DUF2589 domain-containing protein [Desulfosarcina sp.]
MAEENTITPFAEFQSLPLSYILAEPLNGVVKAHMLAAQTTREYIEKLKDESIEFSVKKTAADGSDTGQEVRIVAPILSIIPVPNLRIDSLSVNFRYSINHTLKDKKDQALEAKMKAGTTGWLSSFVDVSLSGSVSTRSSSESEMNRSGTLEISMQASEAEQPEGLKKILNMLANTISETEV